MATIKKFNSENFNINIIDAMNLHQGDYSWGLDLKVEVTDKETGIKVYTQILENRMVPMWDTSENWYNFIEEKIEDDTELDEDLDYWDADEELQNEFDEMIEEQYIDCFFEAIADDYGYELDEDDLNEIFDSDKCWVIIDGNEVWFTWTYKWDRIGYNVDTENEVYECADYLIEEVGWDKYEIRDKNSIKIVKDLFGEVV